MAEAGDAVGGRVRTDEVDGFRLDRGFRVMLTGYPELRANVDLPALGLRAFSPGVTVRRGGRFRRLACSRDAGSPTGSSTRSSGPSCRGRSSTIA